LIFNRWLEARETGSERLERIYQRRWFVPAFNAWIGEHPPRR